MDLALSYYPSCNSLDLWQSGASCNAGDGSGSASPGHGPGSASLDPTVALPGAGASANPGDGQGSASSGDGRGSANPAPMEALHGAGASANPGDGPGSASPFFGPLRPSAKRSPARLHGLLSYRVLAHDAEQPRVHSAGELWRAHSSACY